MLYMYIVLGIHTSYRILSSISEMLKTLMTSRKKETISGKLFRKLFPRVRCKAFTEIVI